ncbi:MAG: helix-turn-helix transcriptional regulator [Actinomycetota bacterium]
MASRQQLAARRKALGFSQESLAEHLQVTTSAVSRWEQGVATPKATIRRPLADVLDLSPVELDFLLDADEDEQREQLQALNGHVVPPWLRHFASLEQSASEFRTFEPMVVPALLQTEAYAQSVERAYHRPVTHTEVSRRVEVRLQRQQVLTRRPDPLRMLCVIDESVLIRMIGDPTVMREQLQHLALMAARPNVELRLAPLDAHIYGAAIGAFQLMTAPGDASPFVACTEDLASMRYHDNQLEVESYAALFDHLFAVALHPTDTIERIRSHEENFR